MEREDPEGTLPKIITFRSISYLGQIQEEVGRLPRDGCLLTQLAARLLQLRGIHQLATFVTLVTSSVLVATQRTFTLHKTVCQKPDTK